MVQDTSKTIYTARPEQSDKQKEEEQKLNNLVQRSERVLYSLSTVFPFTLFPTTIVIDEYKVSIADNSFFKTRHIFSALIKDIKSVIVNTGPFFASLALELAGFMKNAPEPVNYLKKDEAVRARRIIMGLVACDKEGIDLSQIPPDELVRKVESIGRSRKK